MGKLTPSSTAWRRTAVLTSLVVLASCDAPKATKSYETSADIIAKTARVETDVTPDKNSAAGAPVKTAGVPGSTVPVQTAPDLGHGVHHMHHVAPGVRFDAPTGLNAQPAAAATQPQPAPQAAMATEGSDWNLKYNGPGSLPYKVQKQISLVIETNHPETAAFDQDHPGPVITDKIARFRFAVATLTPNPEKTAAIVQAESHACQEVTTGVNPRWDWGVTAITDKPFKLRLEVDQVTTCDSPVIPWKVKDYAIQVNASILQKALIWALGAKLFLLGAFAFIAAAAGAVTAVRGAVKKA